MCFDDLKDGAELLARTAELYNLGYPRSEIIKTLNDERFRSARQDYFTATSVNALFLALRHKGMIGCKPTLRRPWWQSGELSSTIGIKAATLTGWRHRGWVQAKQFGTRWLYWADVAEMDRLRQLGTYSAGIEKPDELTRPINKMK